MTRPDWHFITCEYPPEIGGVADFSAALAGALSTSGERVHVWCPSADGQSSSIGHVTVHRELGRFSRRDLRRASHELDRCPSPRRLFVQWVPHGYGYRSLNVGFAAWLARRASRGDIIDLVVHEPFLDWSSRPTVSAAAAVHRAMLWLAARSATRLWITIPAWEARIRPFVGRHTPIRWLPVPSPIAVVKDDAGVALQRRRMGLEAVPVVGHFSGFSPLITDLLGPALAAILDGSRAHALLVGKGSKEFGAVFAQGRPDLAERVHTTGPIAPDAISRHLQVCDAMMQPYPDGISSRRTTAVALAAHGLPVVTNAGHLTDAIWTNEDSVALAHELTPAAFCSAVLDVLNRPDRRVTLQRRITSVYENIFRIDRVLTRLVVPSSIGTSGSEPFNER